MAFNGLTKLGKEYLATKLATGKGVEFSKIEIGNGALTGTPEEVIQLFNFKKNATIISKEQFESTFKLKIGIDNSDVNTGYYATEIGIYVNDNGRDVLYHYIYEDNGSYIPDKNSPISYKWTINTQVSNTESVILNWNGGELFVTQSKLETELTKYEKSFTKNTAFNKNFGTNSLEVLEGAKLAEILGVNYGGVLNNNLTKTAGLAYYDTATKAVYLCKISNNLNYADLTKFEDFSNKGLLGKLENLKRVNILDTNIYLGPDNGLPFGGVIATINLSGYSRFDYCFVTPSNDITRSIVPVVGVHDRFSVVVTGGNGYAQSRSPQTVVFDYNSSTHELKLGTSAVKPGVHFMGIYGYKD